MGNEKGIKGAINNMKKKLKNNTDEIDELEQDIEEIKSKLNTKKYIVKLTRNGLLKVITGIVGFLTATGVPSGMYIFNNVVEMEVFKIEKKYTETISNLKDKIAKYEEVSTFDKKKLVTLIEDKEFLKLHSQYDIAERKYDSNRTEFNLSKLMEIQNDYVRYVKYRRLKKINNTNDYAGYTFFGDKVRYVDGIPYHIPKDVLMKAGL